VKETKRDNRLNFGLNTMEDSLAVFVLETVIGDELGGPTIKKK
jgi:hypothetical protein